MTAVHSIGRAATTHGFLLLAYDYYDLASLASLLCLGFLGYLLLVHNPLRGGGLEMEHYSYWGPNDVPNDSYNKTAHNL